MPGGEKMVEVQFHSCAETQSYVTLTRKTRLSLLLLPRKDCLPMEQRKHPCKMPCIRHERNSI
jgi:hypothetical protein